MEKLNSQERIMAEVETLVQNHVTGMTNKELAQTLGTGEVIICRDMGLLEKRGWIIRGMGARWRLSPKFGGFAGHIIRSYQEAKLRLTEEEARYASAMQ